MIIPPDLLYLATCSVIYLPVSFFVTRNMVKNRVEDTFFGNIFCSLIISLVISFIWPFILLFGIMILPHYLIGKLYDK